MREDNIIASQPGTILDYQEIWERRINGNTSSPVNVFPDRNTSPSLQTDPHSIPGQRLRPTPENIILESDDAIPNRGAITVLLRGPPYGLPKRIRLIMRKILTFQFQKWFHTT